MHEADRCFSMQRCCLSGNRTSSYSQPRPRLVAKDTWSLQLETETVRLGLSSVRGKPSSESPKPWRTAEHEEQPWDSGATDPWTLTPFGGIRACSHRACTDQPPLPHRCQGQHLFISFLSQPFFLLVEQFSYKPK